MKKTMHLIFLCALIGCGCTGGEPDASSVQQESEISSEKKELFQADTQELTIEIEGSQEEEHSLELPVAAADETPGLTYADGILLVNKKHGLPADYAPGVDPTAQEQCSKLLEAMMAQGLDISWSTSNFRDYAYQEQLYNNYVAANGQEAADTFSARPGFSEHQTGLAFDLMDTSGQLLTSPAEAQWLLDHSWEYGFIVRYQEGKEEITGYQAEPWHIRYIGPKARDIALSGLTLEEYLNLPGGDYQ